MHRVSKKGVEHRTRSSVTARLGDPVHRTLGCLIDLVVDPSPMRQHFDHAFSIAIMPANAISQCLYMDNTPAYVDCRRIAF